MREKIRRILRDFFNESYKEIEGDEFIPHAGNESGCKLCQIEEKAITAIENLK